MNLHETFKLFEDMWEDSYVADDYGTSSIEVSLDGQQGTRVLDKSGIPHKEAYEELLKVLKSVASKDLTELSIYWVADRLKPGDRDADAIVIVDSFQYLIDVGEDIEDAEKRGYDLRIPANRLILPYAYYPADLGLPEDAYDVIEAALTPAKKLSEEMITEAASTPVIKTFGRKTYDLSKPDELDAWFEANYAFQKQRYPDRYADSDPARGIRQNSNRQNLRATIAKNLLASLEADGVTDPDIIGRLQELADTNAWFGRFFRDGEIDRTIEDMTAKLTKEEKQLIRPELDSIRQKLISIRKKSKKV